MKLIRIVIPCMAGMVLSCSGNTDKTGDDGQTKNDTTEEIQQATREVQQVVDSTDAEIESLQKDIDDILNEI
jgi:peptidoglycan hydrolase CwlO-like protein